MLPSFSLSTSLFRPLIALRFFFFKFRNNIAGEGESEFQKCWTQVNYFKNKEVKFYGNRVEKPIRINITNWGRIADHKEHQAHPSVPPPPPVENAFPTPACTTLWDLFLSEGKVSLISQFLKKIPEKKMRIAHDLRHCYSKVQTSESTKKETFSFAFRAIKTEINKERTKQERKLTNEAPSIIDPYFPKNKKSTPNNPNKTISSKTHVSPSSLALSLHKFPMNFNFYASLIFFFCRFKRNIIYRLFPNHMYTVLFPLQ